MLEVDQLSVSYGKNLPDVIKNMSFKVEKGCVLNILGQNAVGKTTIIRTIMRELQNYRGLIKINGLDIRNYNVRDYSKLIGVVSTSSNVFQNLLVADYLVTGFINQMKPFSSPKSDYIQKAYDTLATFGKHELFNAHMDQLSSGEKQIVQITRVLLQNPEIIIFDEPTANLDVKNQLAVLNEIKRLSDQGYTVLVTTHNPGHANLMGGKTLIMGKGKYIFGNTSEIISEQILSEYYELSVKIKTVGDIHCLAFQNINDNTGIQIVY